MSSGEKRKVTRAKKKVGMGRIKILKYVDRLKELVVNRLSLGVK